MSNKTLKQVLNALDHFSIDGEVISAYPYGNGHINDTFLITAQDVHKKQTQYIIQAVNHNVFKEPEKVLFNIAKVTEFLKGKSTEARQVLHLIPTTDGAVFFCDKEGFYWRVYDFITDSICLDIVESEEDFYECAYAFGNFQKDLSEFDAESLYETIPNFHNTPVRYNNFLNAVKNDIMGRAKSVQKEIDFIIERAEFYSVLLDANKDGKLPLRVSHNDTKSNNVMLDSKTRKALCVIDLDTVMPGFSVTDFGDAIRFGATTAAEDEKDLDKVNFDISLFKAYTKGFLEGCNGQLQNSEIMLLPEGAKMMTIECGMRFLTDYLEGDTYFKTAYSKHNLVRCRTQLKLVADMEEQWEEMKNTVKIYCK